MHRVICKILIAIFFIPSLAQSEETLDTCATLDVINYERLLECVRLQSTVIQSLNDRVQRNSVPAVGEHPETKAIVAFYAEKGQKACPLGWSLYEEAKDRMIVGAGALYQYPGEMGGEREVVLTVEQMANHNHHFRHFFSNKEGTDETFDESATPRVRAGLNTDSRWTGPWVDGAIDKKGGSQPHNNMPPYIALYFCKKD